MAGFKHDGAFAEYMLADPETTVHLPEGVSFEQGAPLMCAGVREPLASFNTKLTLSRPPRGVRCEN